MGFIVITGTPGVGKTNTSRILARKLKATHIDLNKIVLNERLTVGYDKKRKCFIADFKKISEKISKVMKKLGKRTTILDGHYAVLVAEPSMIEYVFVLRCNPEELETRLKNRRYLKKKMAENVMAEILGACLSDAIVVCGREKVYQIDVTQKSPDEVVSDIIGILDKKGEGVENIDWISEMEKNGKIERLLDYGRQLQ